ncbi:hypothetical protein AQ490_15470 [Wenjunlia vitaminophila]|uniref:EamA domain-containing protein n=1 Tax=Wenjunlia vitaminophila TaxID=76728 RepID=A0A0T6LXM1_WENVI|nr:EamA family transporter [Wenjunlia vitaminophila]KRV50479.1 hypothetical protein AQ490_15470 [Wenjunlia vitaminophila]
MAGAPASGPTVQRKTLPVLLFALIVALWGSTWIGIQLQLGSVDPAVSVAYRFLLAQACMFAWCFARRLPLRFPGTTHLRFALVGLLQYCGNYVLFYYASDHMVSGLVSIVFALSVGFNILGGVAFLGRKVTLSVVAAAGSGVLGLVLVFWQEISAAGGSDTLAIGVLLGVGGTASFSLGNIVSAKNHQAGLPVVQATAWSMLYGSLFTSLGCLATGQRFTVEMSWSYLAGLAYLALFGSAFAYVAYLTLLGWIGPDRAAFATVVFPLVSLLLSTIFEDYSWSALAFVGVAVVLAANAVILVGPQLRTAALALAPGRKEVAATRAAPGQQER